MKLIHRIRGRIFIDNGGVINIGDHCRFNSAVWANPTTQARQVTIRIMENGVLKIGNHCGISNSSISCAEEVTIEDYVMIGSGCCIWDTDFHPISYKGRTNAGGG